jgi:hypothetical protein
MQRGSVVSNASSIHKRGLQNRNSNSVQKIVISDLRRENQFLSKEIWESIRLISPKEICKLVLQAGLYGAWHNMESLSEFGPSSSFIGVAGFWYMRLTIRLLYETSIV